MTLKPEDAVKAVFSDPNLLLEMVSLRDRLMAAN